MATQNIAYGSPVAMTVTNLQSLANDSSDPYAGWQSVLVDNRTTLAMDYEICLSIPMANTAPANDSQAYVYLLPWTHNGTSWIPGGNFGTTTAPSGSEGTASMSDPNSMRGPLILPYKVAQQTLNLTFLLSELCSTMPDGWSLAYRNCTGAAGSTGATVTYRPITYTVA